jgi:dolichol-phosphate mannosyltransferase
MSLVAGIDHSNSDALVMMDCDLQHPPFLIPKLLEAFERGYDVVHAIRRYTAGSMPALKRLPSRLFYRLQNALSPVEIEEGSADFRLISRKVAEVFKADIREQNQFLRGLFRWVGFSSCTIEFDCHPRTEGATKYRLGRLLSFSIQGITSFSKVPLRIATILGGALSFVSLLYGFWSMAGYFITRELPPGYTSLIVAMMFIGGLQLLVLGVLGEYLGSIFDEVKKRPLYIIDEVVSYGDPRGRGASRADPVMDMRPPESLRFGRSRTS